MERKRSKHNYTSFNSPEYHKEVQETLDYLMEKIDATDWDSIKSSAEYEKKHRIYRCKECRWFGSSYCDVGKPDLEDFACGDFEYIYRGYPKEYDVKGKENGDCR